MITGVHTMIYASQAEELRAFLRDKLGFKATDVGHGWLIFDLPEAEMGCHPADPNTPGKTSGTHDISFYTDDIRKTIAELKTKGVEFTQDVKDEGYGLVTFFRAPGNLKLQLYQPKYQKH
jgi:catechol 2,3-dioxygenase-like lactoylglutathione lyase family enzyme